MKRTCFDVIVIGAGPAGLAAAIAARHQGARDVLVIDREIEPGGILLQCVHSGFGLEMFREDLPGPTYAQRFVEQAHQLDVRFLLDTMVLDISSDFHVLVTNNREGIFTLKARAIVLAMGCRERSRAQIRLPGSRPAGVYTAGTAQRWVNIEGIMPGKRFVILGSGDIGMIMARRLQLEGAEVDRVVEILPYLSGLSRNLVQCLQDYDIPLFLQHTVTNVIGNQRVEAVEVCQVDSQLTPQQETRKIIPCDTLLLSVGLIPENELTRRIGIQMDPVTGGPLVNNLYGSSVPGFFVAGNVVHVYDLVDSVSSAGEIAGHSAALFASGQLSLSRKWIPVQAGEAVRSVVPQRIQAETLSGASLPLQLRVLKPMEHAVEIVVKDGGEKIAGRKLPYARPGEMLTINIPQAAFPQVKAARALTVSMI